MHPALERIRAATEGSPYEGCLWLVGGAVRDEMLGRTHSNDFDIVLETDALELAKFLRERGASDIDPVVYPRFGTARLQLEGAAIELATSRKESYDDQSRKPSVESATLLDDAKRRDFTVNALMRNLHTGELLDLLGSGLADLRARLLRTPLDPAATFYDDPLRMLRAVRFRWQLGFTPVEGLYQAVKAEAYRLEIISEERIRDEWVKMLLLPDADKAMQDLMTTGLLARFAPEFLDMVGVDQGSFHHLDVWEHTLLVLRNAGPGNLELALAALLHDVGKPMTRFIDESGHTRFFGHEYEGAKIAGTMLRRLKFSNEQIEEVVLLVKNHMRLGSSPVFTPAAARRLVRDLDDHLEDLFKLVDADVRGLKPGVRTMDLKPFREQVAKVTKATPRSSLVSPLTGEEIMEIAGLEPGPRVGVLKAFLLEKVLEGELQPGDKERARELLKIELI